MKNIDYLLFSKSKINDFLFFRPDNSFEKEKKENNIFPLLNKDFIIHDNNNKNNKNKINNNEKIKNDIVVEKGLIISPKCLASKSKYSFGSKKLEIKIQNSNSNEKTKENINNTRIIINNNSKNKDINSLDKLFSKQTKISRFENLFDENKKKKNENGKIKINSYKSRNKGYSIEGKNNSNKNKNFFTNETLSSCIKDVFDKKIFKLKDKNNFSLSNSHKNKQLTLSTFLNKKNITRNNNDFINDYNYKTINKLPISTRRDFFYKRKNKYTFKCNPYQVTGKFVDLPEKLKLLNNNNLKTLQKEAKKYFGNSFSLVQTEKFPYKFRNPLVNNNIMNDNDDVKNEKEKSIKENIISGMDIIQEINDRKNNEKIFLNPKKLKIDKKKLYSKFKSILIQNSNYIKHISISSNELINKNTNDEQTNKTIHYFVNKIKNISQLIQAIKIHNLDKINELIEKNHLCVRDCDMFKYSTLHWAAKKDFFSIIPKLISFGVQVNSQTFLGDTPLHISVKRNNYESTVLLLIYLASPFIKNNMGKKPFDSCKDYQMNIIYKKITSLHYKNMFVRNKLIYDNIQNEFIRFILEEFGTQLKKECLIIVEDIQREKKNRNELELKIKKKEKENLKE